METNRNEPTPGPWRVGDAKHTIFGPPTENPSPEIIASLGKNFKNNASLIAAALDLLAAAKYVVQWHRECDSGEGEMFGLDFVTTCIAAIAKAEGR
jgi:hypothetical protein